MSWNFPNYPDNWKDMKEAIFLAYGGKYCTKGLFKGFGHKGYIQVHHYVSLSKAKNNTEYYFLNQPWNLVPLCEKHHNREHAHMNNINGYYNREARSKKKKVSKARRLGWHVKRRRYHRKFNKRDKDKNVLYFWNYWKSSEKRLKNKMETWPTKFLEDCL